VNEPGWWAYFKATAGTEDGATIAVAAGVTPPQVSRWKSQKNRPDADRMTRFARHYGRPPVEALVAAGYLTADEAAEVITITTAADALSDEELVDEIADRLAGRRGNGGQGRYQSQHLNDRVRGSIRSGRPSDSLEGSRDLG
jgi:transcriptional regulator with XRE-family HTH domain